MTKFYYTILKLPLWYICTSSPLLLECICVNTQMYGIMRLLRLGAFAEDQFGSPNCRNRDPKSKDLLFWVSHTTMDTFIQAVPWLWVPVPSSASQMWSAVKNILENTHLQLKSSASLANFISLSERVRAEIRDMKPFSWTLQHRLHVLLEWLLGSLNTAWWAHRKLLFNRFASHLYDCFIFNIQQV